MGLMKLRRPGSTRGEAGSHCHSPRDGGGGGRGGESSLQGTNGTGSDRCSPVCASPGQVSCRSSGEGLLVKSVTEVPPPTSCEVSPGRETRVPGDPLFYGCKLFSSQMKETCVCAGWGRNALACPQGTGAQGHLCRKADLLPNFSPAPRGGSLKATERPGRCWSSPKPPTSAPLGFEGRLVARLCQAALRQERARREKERDRGRSRGRGDARGRRLGEAARKREGAGRDRGAASAPRRRTAPGGAREGASRARRGHRGRVRAQRGRGGGIGSESALSPGRGGGIGVAEGAGYLPGPRPGRGRAGGRAVSGRVRSGRPGPCGAPGTAATAEGHGEEGASHGGAPRPPPAS